MKSSRPLPSVVAALGLGVALAGVAACGDDAPTPAQVCAEACAELTTCGLVTTEQAEACATGCKSDPTIAFTDDGTVDPACADADDPCDCVGHTTALFDEGFVLSAFPATRATDGTLVRACGGETPAALLVEAVLVAHDRSRLPESAGPETTVDFHPASATLAAALDVQLDCLEPVGAPSASCGGEPLGATVEAGEWTGKSTAASRRVVVVLDRSGSLRGDVDAADGASERPSGTFTVDSNYGELASDAGNASLITLRRLIRALPATTDLCVLAASEAVSGGLAVPRAAAAGLTGDAALNACFDGGAHATWLAEDGLGAHLGAASGRAPLWAGVDAAMGLLAARAGDNAEGHVLVVSDGPDTCVGESGTSCVVPCPSPEVGVEDVLERLASAGASAPQIDFVQFEAPGYPGRDPRQAAVACASGGQHVFIDAPVGGPAGAPALFEKLPRAVTAVQASWDGLWRFAVGPADATRQSILPDGTAVGSLLAVRGSLTVGAEAGWVGGAMVFPMGVEERVFDANGEAVGTWDRRPTFRVACGSAADCGGEVSDDACGIVCSAETGLCASADASLPDGAACDAGICCAGTCSASGTCCAP